MEMKPWISLRSGLIIMAIVSIGLGINTGWQAVAQGRTVIDGVLFGMFFGGSIWLIFLGAVLLQRLLRKGREKQK